MTKMDENLSELLGIAGLLGDSPVNPADLDAAGEFKTEPRPDVEFVIEDKPTVVPDLNQSDAKTDYAYARSLNYTLIKMTTQALARSLEIVRETEAPRAFEAFNNLATTVRGLNKDLLDLQKVYKEVTKDRPEMNKPPVDDEDSAVEVSKANKNMNVLQLLQEAIDRGEISPVGSNGGS